MKMKKILLAEDEEHIAKLIKFKLQHEGYEVEVVNNGKDVIQKLEQSDFEISLLILDMMMPVMNGWEVLEKLKENKNERELNVLVLTARASKQDVARAISMGASDFVKKPFDPDELIVVVRKLIVE